MLLVRNFEPGFLRIDRQFVNLDVIDPDEPVRFLCFSDEVITIFFVTLDFHIDGSVRKILTVTGEMIRKGACLTGVPEAYALNSSAYVQLKSFHGNIIP